MSCVTLTKSRGLGCTTPSAGVLAVGIGAYDGFNRIVTTPTGVTSIATQFPAESIARFELKNTTTKYLENYVYNPDTRSGGYKGSLPAIFNVATGDDLSLAADMSEICKGETVLFLELKNGLIFAVGSQNGAWVVTKDNDTGGQAGDLNGYTVTFNTEEPQDFRLYKLTGTALTDYAAALMPV